MRITSKAIAALCGVSRGTVDRALHDKPGVNAETRRRILATAAEQGYRPDYLGQSLVLGQTRTLGVIVFDLKNPYFAQLVQAIEQAAARLGLAVLISLSEQAVERELTALRHLHERRVDGVILLPVGCGDDYCRTVRALDLPVVTVGNRLPGYDHVGFDQVQASAEAVHFLAGRGYSTLVYVAPPLRKSGLVNRSAPRERLSGVEAAVGALGLDYRLVTSDDYAAEVLDQVRTAVRSGLRTAVLCSSDWYALRILQAARQAGLRIPGDFGLMGYDRLDLFDWLTPRLTSVVSPIAAIGERAVDQVMRRIGRAPTGQAEAESINLPYRIDPGESA
jgi:DNA-binding LacI/PurR family transcriptional regulator